MMQLTFTQQHFIAYVEADISIILGVFIYLFYHRFFSTLPSSLDISTLLLIRKCLSAREFSQLESGIFCMYRFCRIRN